MKLVSITVQFPESSLEQAIQIMRENYKVCHGRYIQNSEGFAEGTDERDAWIGVAVGFQSAVQVAEKLAGMLGDEETKFENCLRYTPNMNARAWRTFKRNFKHSQDLFEASTERIKKTEGTGTYTMAHWAAAFEHLEMGTPAWVDGLWDFEDFRYRHLVATQNFKNFAGEIQDVPDERGTHDRQ